MDSDSTEFSNFSATSNPPAAAATNNLTSTSPFAPPNFAALNLLSDNLDSIFNTINYADAKIAVESGEEVSVHRCILAARSPYLKAKFDEGAKDLQLKDLAGDFGVGFEALVMVLEYLYGGKVRPLPREVCVCVDGECDHVGCRPAVDFMAEVLYLSFKFQIAALVSLFQRRLLEVLEKITPDDLLVVLCVANLCESACQGLHKRCVEIIVNSDVDSVALEKSLPTHIAKLIMDERKELGLISLEDDGFPDKHVKRIHRALDSGDIELVRMLLNEKKTTLEDACAFHYAAAYCNAKTTSELISLGRPNVNHKDLRGYSLLHVAAMRRDPMIILSLLKKGAWPTDVTPDVRNALRILKRLTKAADWHKSPEDGKPSHKDRVCIEIILQAERRDEPMFSEEASPALAGEGDDLRSKLLYLESRVAFANMFFPLEAKAAMGTAQVGGTTAMDTMDQKEAPFIITEYHRQRIRALEETVELGKLYFPRCYEEVDKLMDTDTDDLMDLDSMGSKRQRFMDYQETFSKALTEDLEAKKRSTVPSSSSSKPLGKKHRGRLSNKR